LKKSRSLLPASERGRRPAIVLLRSASRDCLLFAVAPVCSCPCLSPCSSFSFAGADGVHASPTGFEPDPFFPLRSNTRVFPLSCAGSCSLPTFFFSPPMPSQNLALLCPSGQWRFFPPFLCQSLCKPLRNWVGQSFRVLPFFPQSRAPSRGGFFLTFFIS